MATNNCSVFVERQESYHIKIKSIINTWHKQQRNAWFGILPSSVDCFQTEPCQCQRNHLKFSQKSSPCRCRLRSLFMWYRWTPTNPSDLSPAPSSLHSVASNPGVPAAWQRKTHGADLCGQVPNPKMALEPKSSGPSTWDSFGPNGVYHCAPLSHFFGLHSWYLLSKPKVPKNLLIKRTEFLNPVTIWATAAEKTPAINRSSPQCSTKAPLHLQISQLKTFNQRKSGRNSHATTGQPIKQYIHYIYKRCVNKTRFWSYGYGL